MAHPNWCKLPCSDCISPCNIDSIIPCSPDCPGLNDKTGEKIIQICKSAECDIYTFKIK